MTSQQEVEKLKSELMGLFHYIKRVREEIAAISRPAEKDYHFKSMADQLDAIVAATEKATNTIMATVEKNGALIADLRTRVDDPVLDKLIENSNIIFEACSFQDITGQRVNKVVKSIKYVEERISSIVTVWGKAALEEVEVMENKKTEDEKLIHGPQHEGEGLDQSTIDALFD